MAKNPTAALEKTIGHRFKDNSLLSTALTHRSLARDEKTVHNQRLEFLGDAVLGLLIAEMLYEMFPDADEGDLSRRLVSLVNGEQLAVIGEQLGLGALMHMSESEIEQGGRSNTSNLEDACEALLGALYLDGGLKALRGVINAYWKPLALELKEPPKDPKTTLQEWAQARSLPLPDYQVLSADGPAHAPQFIIEVVVSGKKGRGEAGNKKLAERLAAEALLKQLSA